MSLSATFRGIELLKSKCRAIHAASRELQLDEETRRALIENVAGPGKRSTLGLTLDQADRVLDLLKKRGATLGTKKTRGIPANFDKDPYYRKIEALLADMQLPWAYAQRIAENVTGGKKPESIKRLEWVKAERHFRAVITALAKEKEKRQGVAWQALAVKLQARGLNMQWAAEQALAMGRTTIPWPWTDCLETLRMIDARLEKI